MRIELAPFQVTPDERARILARRSQWFWALTSGGLWFAMMGPFLSLLGYSWLIALPFALLIACLAPWNNFHTTRQRLQKEKGLPWEEQKVIVGDEGYETTYDSGFKVFVPWTKVLKTLRLPEGILLDLEGKAQSFVPSRVLDASIEAFIVQQVHGARQKD